MKNNTLKLISLIMTAVLMFSFIGVIPASAEVGAIQPRNNNVGSCNIDFYVSGVDSATLEVSYRAIDPQIFTLAKITVEIQKQSFWFIWTTVDIGTDNNKWSTYNTDPYGSFSKTFAINGAGTDRAIIRLEFSGAGTGTDIIEKTIEITY